MRRILIALLLAALAASMLAAASADAEPRLEGPGWDTPEAAVLAYLEGLNQGDATAMLSTFALESYAANIDSVSWLRLAGVFQPNFFGRLPICGDYARSLMVVARHASLTDRLFFQYAEYATRTGGKNILCTSDEELQALLDQFTASPVNAWAGKVAFVAWLDPTAVSAEYADARNLTGMALMALCIGVEDLTCLAAHVRLDGVDAVQVMRCAKYGGRWYNLDLGGKLSVSTDLSTFNAGLAYSADAETSEVVAALLSATPDPEAKARLDACAASDLPGTQWRLASLRSTDDGSPLHVDGSEAADGVRESADRRAWGELRFMRDGVGTLRGCLSPALADELGLQSADVRLGLVWTEEGGAPVLLLCKSLGFDGGIDLSETPLRRDGDTLALEMPGGPVMTFQRVTEGN